MRSFRVLFIAIASIVLTYWGTGIGLAGTWEKTFGGAGFDDGYSVKQTTDGGYIIAGATESFGAGNEDVYFIKTDASGNLVWSTTFGGSGSDHASEVQQTSDGGYIIVGETESFGQGSQYKADVYLIKTDASGNLVWSKTFGGSEDDAGYSVKQTADGGYIIVGGTYSFGTGGRNIYLIKTDSSGNHVWSKTFGSSWSWGRSVLQSSDNGYIIGATEELNSGNTDILLLKTDANGIAEWSTTFGTTGEEYAGSVQQASDGGYIIAGKTGTWPSTISVYLIKTDSAGNKQWSKTFATTNGVDADASPSVHQTDDGGYAIATYTYDDLPGWLIKTDSQGNLAWSKTLVGYTESGDLTGDGGYVLIGSKDGDVYLVYYKPETPSTPTSPAPANAAANICTNPVLSWTSDGTATSYDVYFGTDSTPDTGEFQGNQTSTQFRPGKLAPNTTFYWRVDAKNEFGTTTGDVWSFTTGNKPCVTAMPWILLLLSD